MKIDDEISEKESNILSFIFFFVVLVMPITYFIFKDRSDNKEIENNKGITVAKYSFCKPGNKSTTTAFCKFYVNGTNYRISVGGCPENSPEILNKYYVLYYSKLDPNKAKIDFSKEVTDTTEIIQAGFSKNEILGKPSTYDWDWPQ